MTARLTVKRAQLRALAAAAREEGCIAEIERDGVIYRLTPKALVRNREQDKKNGGLDIDTAREFELD